MRPKLFKVEATLGKCGAGFCCASGGKIQRFPIVLTRVVQTVLESIHVSQDAQGRGYVRQVCGGLLVHQQVVDS